MTSGWGAVRCVVQPVLADGVASGWKYYAGLAVVLGVTTLAIVVFYREWQEMHDVEEPDQPKELLDSFVQAHAQGDLDAGELERVRRLLSDDSEGGEAGTPAAGGGAKTPGALRDSAAPAPRREPD
ncbi:MAG: hypothetical protein ACYC61_27600 [Isosphaeraceae bacterium]